MAELEIKNLYVRVNDKEIIRDFSLTIRQGEIHALMGPNGTGKSTLAYAIMGHPRYEISGGDVLVNGESILGLSSDERAHKGIFLAFQYPVSIPGVSLANFLRVAVNARNKALNPEDKGISVVKFRQLLKSKMDLLKMDYQFAGRYLNEGFSGGEKKRAEILQMAMLEPRFAILDETDSGLDIDALRIVSEGVNTLAQGHIGVLVITHYQRMLNYINPDFVHIMYGGRIVESGKAGLALRLEEQGYDWIREKYGVLSDSAQE
ncbi:MAG TPA: Fe-S cluster assembly ATPase SufC [Anaerolineaceae bacterium]|jgi:Fe-S cluster assembly ATP-binding protein|nr:Fe-S cluster assembly ATPase SufC [Anaerolineaceae bacterium]HOR83800.1 Fe-S cluster assembly ATPase SufC [Anaerolineaceae bacterium]HPL42676.1 Fe-S cluster assembly ATPase SufC [Anaerolineaceae bacterium]HPY32783.1 Fe-S cluster assembly ATPase SufC [Anaerolineaceae bacterium]HQC20404.1 Fe-S cluster assembly ATPase SufC [Anaerolineaceae bacterium]